MEDVGAFEGTVWTDGLRLENGEVAGALAFFQEGNHHAPSVRLATASGLPEGAIEEPTDRRCDWSGQNRLSQGGG